MEVDRPFRVAFVEGDLSAGGATIFILELATELQRRGMKCHVFHPEEPNSLAADFAARQIPVTSGGERSETIFEERLIRILTGLRAFAPDAVIVGGNGTRTGELLRYLPAALTRMVVFHLATLEAVAAVSHYRAQIGVAVGVSPAVVEILREVFPSAPPRVLCIEPGIVAPPASGPRLFPESAPLRLLYLGRLAEAAKRVHLFPAILRELEQSGIPFHWTIAGEGEARANLEREMQPRAPHQQVRFHGLVRRRTLPALLAEHDVLLLTSDTESFCLSLHEAMNAGLVPVASRLPGRVGEMVTSETGVPVEVNDVAGYAAGVVYLHHHRAEMAARSAAAQARVHGRNGMRAIGDAWAELLRAPAPAPVVWAARWQIAPPLGAVQPWRYTWAGRLLRRGGAWWHRLRREKPAQAVPLVPDELQPKAEQPRAEED